MPITNIPAKSIPEMVYQTVGRMKDKAALHDPNFESGYTSVTYRELWSRVESIATGLLHQDVQPGDRVGIIADGRSWWPVVDLAIQSLGAWTVPIYPSLPQSQAAHIVRHSEMCGLFVENLSQLTKFIDASKEEPLTLRFVVVLEDESMAANTVKAPWPVYTYRSWLSESPDQGKVQTRMKGIRREDVATIVYTSGTTGLPKGVCLTHENILSNIEGIKQAFQLKPEDRALSYLPLSHIFERTCGQFVPLEAGASIAYSRGFQKVAEDFQLMPPTIFTTVPRLLEKVHEKVFEKIHTGPKWKQTLFHKAVAEGEAVRVDHTKNQGWKMSCLDRLVFQQIHKAMGGQLRMVISGGAAMPQYVGRFFTAAGVNIIEGYGMTETSPVIAVNPPDHSRLGTVGKPLLNTEIKLADDGELMVRGPGITTGYYRDPIATSEALTQDGWLHTGDIAELTDGYIRITDRKKNLIILSTGKNVAPAPIEADILRSPYVDQVLLLGQGRKFIAAMIVPQEDLVNEWLNERGLNVSRAGYATCPELVTFLEGEVARETKDYPPYERPKHILLAREPFTVENQLLTPTLKVRAKNVLLLYGQEIESAYEQWSIDSKNHVAAAVSQA